MKFAIFDVARCRMSATSLTFLLALKFERRSTVLRGRRARFLRYSNEPLPYLARLVQSRAGFERTPFMCWAAVGRLIRAPAGLLSSTSTHIGGRRQAVGRSLPGCRPTPSRVLGEHRQTYWLLTESRTAPALMSSELCPTHVSVLTGAGRLVIDIPPICPYFLGFRVGKYAVLAFKPSTSQCKQLPSLVWISECLMVNRLCIVCFTNKVSCECLHGHL